MKKVYDKDMNLRTLMTISVYFNAGTLEELQQMVDTYCDENKLSGDYKELITHLQMHEEY